MWREATAPVATSLVASVAAHQKAPVGGSPSQTAGLGVCEGNFGQERTLSVSVSVSHLNILPAGTFILVGPWCLVPG